MKKIWAKICEWCSVPTIVLLFLAILSVAVRIVSGLSKGFSDFFNLYISSFIRMILAKITNIFPFSVAETIVISIPVIVFVLIFSVIMVQKTDTKKMARYTSSLLAVLMFMYSVFTLGFSVGYRGTSLEEKLGIERKAVGAEDLMSTAIVLRDNIEKLIPEISYKSLSSSIMPYSLTEMKKKVSEAYSKASEKYDFIRDFSSNVKSISLSVPMTYTHISGVYTYFTGEANININFPDYTLPYTTAHEMSHQRGIAREDEANFMAFLVCMESDDPYVRYSGYFSLFEYVVSALYSANSDMYYEVFGDADDEIKHEINAYREFYSRYNKPAVSNISTAINDNFLKSQGQSEGTRSYGRVVDLAVAYYSDIGD